jgi:hypothetical protein
MLRINSIQCFIIYVLSQQLQGQSTDDDDDDHDTRYVCKDKDYVKV